MTEVAQLLKLIQLRGHCPAVWHCIDCSLVESICQQAANNCNTSCSFVGIYAERIRLCYNILATYSPEDILDQLL